jgi:hypothetical protein
LLSMDGVDHGCALHQAVQILWLLQLPVTAASMHPSSYSCCSMHWEDVFVVLRGSTMQWVPQTHVCVWRACAGMTLGVCCRRRRRRRRCCCCCCCGGVVCCVWMVRGSWWVQSPKNQLVYTTPDVHLQQQVYLAASPVQHHQSQFG